MSYNFNYSDTENEVLRDRLKKARAAALEIKTMVTVNTAKHLKLADANKIIELLQVIIKG